jgi:hypothetical protein
MSAIPNPMLEATPAHPLFPAEQAFLWLPGFRGGRLAYCTHNRMPAAGSTLDSLYPNQLGRDENGASYSPLFPVSKETYISWHLNVTPPFPYHAVPIARTLSSAELLELAKRVIALREEKLQDYPQPLQVLTNENKIFIYLSLTAMLVPARFVLSVVE